MEIWIILGIVVLVALYAIATYNGLVGRRNGVRNAFAQISVQLKRRHDLVPNLVAAVRDAMAFERETLEAVVAARGKAVAATQRAEQGGSAADRAQALAAERELGAGLGRLLAVVEAYPEIRSGTHVSELTEELRSTENRIAFARQHYNDSIQSYNDRVQMFPSNLIAGMFGFRTEEFFQVDAAETAVPTVSLR
ncbi:MAG: LemA family protein [Tistrella sp.]|jgi:LemA protein|uniref:LemA family protein n=2 Tax=Tistrella mobilis TaxID=171437 RepID=I3TVW4_TISMK|nr:MULTISPECIES: LemA family protein [Tistrella]AFK56902.1 LemA family protein [Tistrella mobilis KA081020-065]MAD38874.1 LemA family protein [Tistrella sp.]MBA75485.1 LemA family protein [Tistrella sp.]HAE47513.1 LemA family protein [Tistrella mobilis]